MANILKPDFSTAVGSMAITELVEPFERLEFQFVPQQLNWNRVANEQPITIVNRNNDIPQVLGGNDTLTFQLDFYSEDNDLDDVKAKILWLHSLSYAPMRKVKILWGDFLQDEKWICKSVNSVLSKFMPDNGMKPQQARVDLIFKLAPDVNRTVSNVRIN